MGVRSWKHFYKRCCIFSLTVLKIDLLLLHFECAQCKTDIQFKDINSNNLLSKQLLLLENWIKSLTKIRIYATLKIFSRVKKRNTSINGSTNVNAYYIKNS